MSARELNPPKAQVDAIRAELKGEQLDVLAAMLAISCNNKSFIGECTKVSTLSTQGAAGSAVVITFNIETWELVKKILAAHGDVLEL